MPAQLSTFEINGYEKGEISVDGEFSSDAKLLSDDINALNMTMKLLEKKANESKAESYEFSKIAEFLSKLLFRSQKASAISSKLNESSTTDTTVYVTSTIPQTTGKPDVLTSLAGTSSSTTSLSTSKTTGGSANEVAFPNKDADHEFNIDNADNWAMGKTPPFSSLKDGLLAFILKNIDSFVKNLFRMLFKW